MIQMKLGVISDTHNLLRPEVLEHLMGCDAILHGGDISRQTILDQLQEIAPVYAVRGNNDKEWAEQIPYQLELTLGGLRIYMTHKKQDLPSDLSAYDLVIIGHSHKYDQRAVGNTILLNPGSCGPRRFHQAITMATVEITDGRPIITRIDIPHEGAKTNVPIADLRHQVEIIMWETEKGRSFSEIASRHGMDPSLVEQIARLYVTHPGVTAEGIMRKMGV